LCYIINSFNPLFCLTLGITFYVFYGNYYFTAKVFYSLLNALQIIFT